MSFALDIVTITAVSAGAFFFLAGTVGLLRFPDTLTRLHALTKADNLGLGLVVLGLLPQAESLRGGFKLVCVWLLVLLGGATVSQLIARAAHDLLGLYQVSYALFTGETQARLASTAIRTAQAAQEFGLPAGAAHLWRTRVQDSELLHAISLLELLASSESACFGTPMLRAWR